MATICEVGLRRFKLVESKKSKGCGDCCARNVGLLCQKLAPCGNAEGYGHAVWQEQINLEEFPSCEYCKAPLTKQRQGAVEGYCDICEKKMRE